MSARILDGKKIREEVTGELREEMKALQRLGIRPGLAAVLVGENPASKIYVRSKIRACEALNIYSESIALPDETSTEDLLHYVADLNGRDEIDGILVQLPLPAQIDAKRVLESIEPAKDVDGLHPVSIGNLVSGREGLWPCTPAGILEILRRSRIPILGQRAVVVGRSDMVGKPIAMLLLHNHATVTLCHSKTTDLAGVARTADILVAAIGKPALVTSDFIQPGATVIDVGINRLTEVQQIRKIFPSPDRWLAKLEAKGSLLIGDVHPEEVLAKAGAYTPVPGGVGPLTIAMLMANTVHAARMRRSLRLAATRR